MMHCPSSWTSMRPEEGGTYRFVGEAYVEGLVN
jgi:hypothetical protein